MADEIELLRAFKAAHPEWATVNRGFTQGVHILARSGDPTALALKRFYNPDFEPNAEEASGYFGDYTGKKCTCGVCLDCRADNLT